MIRLRGEIREQLSFWLYCRYRQTWAAVSIYAVMVSARRGGEGGERWGTSGVDDDNQ